MTSFKQISDAHIKSVERALFGFLKTGHCAEMARYHLGTGGKRIRALIPLMVYQSYGKNPEDAIGIGCGVEMIHNATLVHDDLQDGDKVRRGQSTVWVKYSKEQAINCGDAMLFFALQILNDQELDLSCQTRIQSLALKATIDVIEGQAQEFQMKQEPFPGISRYLEVIRGKTSGLFSLPIVAALIALGENNQSIEISTRYANDLGIVFQIQDDLLDIYGEKQRGERASDIREGKVSFLVAHVNDVGSLNDRESLKSILRTNRESTSEQQVDQALEIFEKYNSKKAALNYIAQLENQFTSSSEMKLIPKVREILLDLSHLFLGLLDSKP
jgi:geranylgeranyl diphosphate synthase type I